MSLEQLFEQTVDDETGNVNSPRWQFTYQFNQLDLGGYKNGTSNLSQDEVLWRGPGNPRTNENFPVLPTNISQQVHIFRIGRTLTTKTRLSLTIPMIRQSTDHISIVPGYGNFIIKSEGLGDIKVGIQHRIEIDWPGNISLNAGLSVPTGSIDELGDTPRSPGEQQLPYTMQLGSGTWDVTLGYLWSSADSKWRSSAKTIIRLGKNDRNYRLGNHYSTLLIRQFELVSIFRPYMGLELRLLEKIDGQDDEITVPGNFPYPASITNPDLFGGTSINLLAGAELKTQYGAWQIDLGSPLYQNLNGPQSQNKLKFSLQFSRAL